MMMMIKKQDTLSTLCRKRGFKKEILKVVSSSSTHVSSSFTTEYQIKTGGNTQISFSKIFFFVKLIKQGII